VSKRHYYVIQYHFGADHDILSAPLFGHRRGADFMHWHGPSYMPWPKDAEVLADYGLVDSGDDEALDAVEVRFARDYPWPCELKPGGGWLAPDGKFYPCSWREHIAAADLIALAVYGTAYPGQTGHGTVDRLERLGWLKLYDDLVDWRRDHADLTQAQIETLGELIMLEGQDPDLVDSIRRRLKEA
jgi:hypothetical protein